MRRIAFLFPGQGAQYVGMGQEIADAYPTANNVFDYANDCLNFDIKKLCFEGPEDELVKTENTQPAILATSIAILNVIRELGFEAQITAGLSLGEYSSLVYSGALELSDALKLVKKRGKFMQEAVPEGKGTMAAIMGLDRNEVNDIIKEASVLGVIEGANYNCPGQIVLSGEVGAIEEACKIAKARGARKAVVLPVSAPFHCSLLEPAGIKLKKELDNIGFCKPDRKIISNVTADYVNDPNKIKELLVMQVSKSVLWEDTIELMMNDGINSFIEIGPGKALSSFTKKIAKKHGKKVEIYNVENLETLNKLIESLK